MVTVYRLRQFERQASTLLRKAHSLSCAMIDELGVEHPLTDISDGVVEQAENLEHAIEREAVYLKRKAKP